MATEDAHMDEVEVDVSPTYVDGHNYRSTWSAMALSLVLTVSDFGFYARVRREFIGLSQQAVAHVMKDHFFIPWHQTVVAKIESGDRRVKLAEALALSYIYGLTLDDLVQGINLESTERLTRLTPPRGHHGEHSEEA